MSDHYTASDRKRLEPQMIQIRDYMLTVKWQSVAQIASALRQIHPGGHFPENSIQAQLRNLRKAKFGGYQVEKRRVGEGYYVYRVLPPLPRTQAEQLNLQAGVA